MKQILLTLMVLLFAAGAYADETWKTDTNIPYTSKTDDYSTHRLLLDIHHPEGTASAMPVIVWFHGGGLTGGEKFIPAELSRQGYVVVAPNYRLIPNVGVSECIDDAAEAVAWVADNIAAYGGDPSKIFVTGHSAGGFLTSMIGIDKTYLSKYGKDPDNLLGLIPYSGQVITHFSDRESKGIGALTPYVDDKAPLFHVRKDCPPYIIITGDPEEELYGRYEENLYMWRMMKLAGHPDVRIYRLDGYNHGDMAAPAHHILKKEIARILKERHQ